MSNRKPKVRMWVVAGYGLKKTFPARHSHEAGRKFLKEFQKTIQDGGQNVRGARDLDIKQV